MAIIELFLDYSNDSIRLQTASLNQVFIDVGFRRLNVNNAQYINNGNEKYFILELTIQKKIY